MLCIYRVTQQIDLLASIEEAFDEFITVICLLNVYPPTLVVMPQLLGDVIHRLCTQWRIGAVEAAHKGVKEVLCVWVNLCLAIGAATPRRRNESPVSAIGLINPTVEIVIAQGNRRRQSLTRLSGGFR